MTLIELLVVVIILVILASVTTAMVQPLSGGREIREAARQVNAFIAGGPARAAELGRPSGVWLERAPSTTNTVFELYAADTPPIYAGDLTGATARFVSNTQVTMTGATSMATSGFVQPGDLIRFDYKGPLYPIIAPVSAPTINFTHGPSGDLPPPPHAANAQVPFQIYRQPRKSSIKPLQLPTNAALDLTHSGFGPAGVEFNAAAGPVIIMFASDGAVERVYYNNTSGRPTRNIHLLVGGASTIGADNMDNDKNAQHNRWVSINVQSGAVTTTESMGGGSALTARQFAKTGKGMGGG